MAEIIEDMPNEMQIDYFRAYSGTLEEAVPAASSDVPGVVTRYKPPLSSAPADAKPATAPASAPADAPGTPAAPANSHIASPSNG